MSVAELKSMVDKTTPGERVFLEFYLAHLRRLNDPEYLREITRRNRDMDRGKKIPWKEVKKMHRDMLKQGI